MYLDKTVNKIDFIFVDKFRQITSAPDHGQGALQLVDSAAHKGIGIFLKYCRQISQFKFPVEQFSHCADRHSFIGIIQQ